MREIYQYYFYNNFIITSNNKNEKDRSIANEVSHRIFFFDLMQSKRREKGIFRKVQRVKGLKVQKVKGLKVQKVKSLKV